MLQEASWLIQMLGMEVEDQKEREKTKKTGEMWTHDFVIMSRVLSRRYPKLYLNITGRSVIQPAKSA